jgi:hypothetical protein
VSLRPKDESLAIVFNPAGWYVANFINILLFIEHTATRERLMTSHASVGGPPGPWVTTPEAAPSAVARGRFWAESNGSGLDLGPQRPDTLSHGLWRQGAVPIIPAE